MIAQATPEVPQDPAQLAREHAQSFMGAVVDAKSYPEQWCAYENVGVQAARDGVLAAGLVDYAANEKSTDSLLWRSFALEAGLQGIRSVVLYGGRELSAAERGIYEKAKQVIPEFFEKGFVTQFVGDERVPDNLSYHWFFQQLAKREGINPRMIAVDAYAMGYDPTSVSDNIPVATGLLLNRMMRAETYHDVAALPEGLANDMLRVALNFQGPEYAAAIADKPSHIGEFAQLARLTERAGYEHDVPVAFLYDLEPGECIEYVTALNELYDAGEKLGDVFSTIDPEAVAKGFRGLAANALFALQYYFENGRKIETDVPSFIPGKLVNVREDDPLFVIRTTTQAIHILHHAVTSNDMRPVLEVEDENFSLFRFVDMAGNTPPQVSYLGRPWGGNKFNSKYEFFSKNTGRSDATNRFRVRLSNSGPVALGNIEQTADTVCFRGDYDGFGFAIDIGATSDNPFRPGGDDIEVRMGRFFGFGNFLRSQAVGVDATWHHIRSLHEAVGATEMKFGKSVTEQVRCFKVKAAAMTAGSRAVSRSRQLEQILA